MDHHGRIDDVPPLPEGRAAAGPREALAELCLIPGLCKSGEARRQLETARRIYRQLGAEADIRRVEEQLALFE